MKNVNNCLKTYENLPTLIDSQVVKNFKITEDFIKNYVNLLKENLKNITNDEEKKSIKKHLCNIDNIPREWSVKFHRKTWFKKLGI